MSNCNSCGNCNGNCGNCGGCARELLLTDGEIRILLDLAQLAFLPVARRPEDMTPVYLEDSLYSKETYSLILQCLEQKGLISIDYDKPLSGACMAAYKGYSVHGSMALTQRGQSVIDLLETQGPTAC